MSRQTRDFGPIVVYFCFSSHTRAIVPALNRRCVNGSFLLIISVPINWKTLTQCCFNVYFSVADGEPNFNLTLDRSSRCRDNGEIDPMLF